MKRFRNVLFVADEQSAYEQAFERVCWLAKANAATVTLVDCIDSGGPADLSRGFSALPRIGRKNIEDQVIAVHRAKLEDRAEALRARGVTVETTVLIGTPFIEIIRQVLREKHDLLIKGAHRAARGPFFPGADMHLLRKCPCPVWILNSAAEPRAQRILAAVDPNFEDPARTQLTRMVMELATSLARADGAKLDVVNAWNLLEEATMRHGLAKIPEADVNQMVAKEKDDSEARLQKLVAEFAEFDDIMRVLHIKGMAADVIPEHVAAEGIDTIVMGTLARTGVAGLFIGNTAETILNHVSCSVLTVKAKGFVSPVALEGGAA
ncbi:universal stress protein [Marivita hallyeonensis]|uniref:Nucleotide-binding universal stress protein, UspA family n=1 Tax=Marivita hallyeonensis TaxID=996342 RepID=A0A1M5MDG8_9RHOB|nr:universal stress protein [Marivita hallyeonensis]SHG74949.1 Nucleotide-binding universal stress protein, UspA family [Marivita hallyeonensis]